MPFLINIAAFKIGWLSSVVGGAQQLPWLGPAVVFRGDRHPSVACYTGHHRN